ncbi:substrate-binding domain-containing protein [Planctomicrobium sp. SH661]|uniref:XylR family transcriptional regulator n=1 Tax=Planctomicrobium sp. SH661 TaxID=3448124 RepID=UPI003F5C2038
MNAEKHVGLVIVQNFAYYRHALRGIRRYIEACPEWQVTSLTPAVETLQMRSRFRPAGIIASVTSRQMEQELAKWRRPVVNISAALPQHRFAWVNIDNSKVGELAARHFLELGLRQFAYIGSPDHLFSTERQTAFEQAVRTAGFHVENYRAKRTARPRGSNRDAVPDPAFGQQWELDPLLGRWLKNLPKPVGVFVPLDSWGVQVAEACRRADIEIPEEVALLGVGDDDLYCELTRPALSSIILPAEQVGYEAARLLDRMLGGEPVPREPIRLPPIGITTRASSEVVAVADQSVVDAVSYIRDNAHLPITIMDVLRHVPVGRRTLERRCRAALGWGLGEEIRRARMQRICRLLAGTDLPMQAVAAQSGLSDFRYLAMICRKHLGMSPTAYRRKMRQPS